MQPTTPPSPIDAAVIAEAFAVSPLPSCIVEMKGAEQWIVAASESFGQLLGRAATELVGVRLDDVLEPAPGEPQTRVSSGLERARGALWAVRQPNGSRASVEVHAARVGKAARDLRLVQLVDVSSRETAQRSLRGAVRRLQDIIDNSTALVFVKDMEGRYLLVNRSFERRFGLRFEDTIGRRDDELFPPGIAADYQEHDREVLSSVRPLEVEERGSEAGRTWLSIKFPLLDENGEPYGLGGISTDITERLQIEAAARQARDQAQEASRAKSEFLSRMSHELRTPLNAILGFGQLLELEALPRQATDSVVGIMAAGRHLLGLINEVLDLSRIEAGTLETAIEVTEVCSSLQEALDLVRPLALERDIELASDLHDGLYEYVLADPRGLKQAVLNLIDNAIKYTPPGGGVRVAFRTLDDEHLRVIVVDTGPGLTPEEQSQVFTPFARLPGTSTEAVGTGLGLTLARSLVEAMGGNLGIQHSAPGEGSTFFIDLLRADVPSSAHARPEANPPATEGPAFGRARVLYIEDNPSNLEVVRRILERVGNIEVTAAGDGTLGIQLASSNRPDVVLLDLNLPDIDGEVVLRTLVADPQTRDIPVIVLSADATPARRRDLIADGAYAYVTKPLDMSTFVATVRNSLAGVP